MPAKQQTELLPPANGNGAAHETSLTPMSVLQQAVTQGASVDTLTKLLELQERWEAGEARKAFEEAFAAFKSEAPRLERTKEVSFGNNRAAYKYTPLDTIANTLGPILAKHGLSYNWRQEAAGGNITVTCILRHKLGHSIDNTLSAQADPSGSKNGIQAIGSTVSYLRRYTLLGVLGMATSDEDTDGVTMQSASGYIAKIAEARDLHELESAYKEAIRAGVGAQDSKALQLFFDAREKREKQLRAA